MFQFAGCPRSLRPYCRSSELPHSEISGSQPASGSPEHIGAVPRPSSARSARASIVCSFCLPYTLTRGRARGRLKTISKYAFSKVLGALAPAPLNRDDGRGAQWLWDRRRSVVLPRKEVIHPQLPLRMPCYDFILIADPTVVPHIELRSFGYYRLS